MDLELIINRYFKLINKIFLKSPQKAVVGFDIGTNSIKAVEIGFTQDALEIQRWALEPLEGTDAKSALKKILARMNIQNQIPVASISGKGTLIRYVDMPRMSIDELRKSLVYEIDKYFPFDPQTIYTDSYIIDPQGKDKKMSVLIVAAKKELVDGRIDLFKEAGIDKTHVTTNATATANAFEQLIKAEKTVGARAILDIGGSVSNLMILDKNNLPCFTRDIFIGSQDISIQIANTLGISLAKAEELKHSPAEKLSEITQACEISLDNLIGEINLSFDYFMTEKNTPVTDLFLVGGGALFKGIEGTFEKNLNVLVKTWNPLTGLRLGQQVVDTDIHHFSSQLAVAIGLALTKV